VVFLIDESAGMSAVMGDMVAAGRVSVKPNAERIATALNAVLDQLTRGPDFDVALLGYQADGAGSVNVGSRFGGALAGREFVGTGELRAHPLRVETRMRKLPAPGGLGPPREEQISFPVWYVPALGSKAPQIAAFNYCRELLTRWLATAGLAPGVPLVMHVFSGAAGDGNPQRAVDELLNLSAPSGPPLIIQAHVASSASTVTALYPSSHVYLTVGSARDVFRRASPLPPQLVAALKEAKVPVNAGARAMLYNAMIADIIRALGLVVTHTKDWPSKAACLAPLPDTAATPGLAAAVAVPAVPAVAAAGPGEGVGAAPLAPAPMPEITPAVEAPAPTPDLAAGAAEKAVLLLLVLDRSVAEPFSGNTQNAWAKLQEYANELLKEVSALQEAAGDVAVVSYGLDAAGQVEVRTTFDGPLAGQTIVPHAALQTGALRVEEFQEEISNGLGGLITVTRRKPIFVELEPTGGASPVEAFAAAARIATDWCQQHPNACLPPIVLHLTRGQVEQDAVEQAAGQLKNVASAAGPAAFYHLVVTETPHPSVAYPKAADELDAPGLKSLWQLTSPLLGCQRLAADRPRITAESRGMVVNGKFDLLLAGVQQALTL
jgi:hypothetical protein